MSNSDGGLWSHAQFVDGARRALEAAEGESDQPGTPTSKECEAAAKLLRRFLETFISEEFLPEVYVNFRCGPSCIRCS